MRFINLLSAASLLPGGLHAAILPDQQVPLHLPVAGTKDSSRCPLPPKVEVPEDGLEPSMRIFEEASLRTQVERLSKVVQLPTITHDDMISVDDERFSIFEKLHELLEDLFPLTYCRSFASELAAVADCEPAAGTLTLPLRKSTAMDSYTP